MTKTSNRITFVAGAGKRHKLDRIVEAFGTNLSAVINEAIDHYIDLHEWQLEHIQKGVESARKGEFASKGEEKEFFSKYGQP